MHSAGAVTALSDGANPARQSTVMNSFVVET
jgi:hypothetical protein